MTRYLHLIAFLSFLPAIVFSQKRIDKKFHLGNRTLNETGSFTMMPYNRLIQSAGKVITYGDSSLENHALDVCVLPGKKNVVIEDRYGIAMVDINAKTIVSRWSFTHDKNWHNFVSTYSGITSFVDNNKNYIAWGASAGNSESAIMIAEWDGKKINKVTGIKIEREEPAAKAIPNQIIANRENGLMYLYAVLNGNNQLVKIKVKDKKIVWAMPTGVAPYGICIVNKKAYVTNWAGPLVTDTTLENAGTPWGSAYTNPVTGATNNGSLSIIDIANGTLLNELKLGLHPNAIIKSADRHFLYITNSNSDNVSVVDVDKEKVVDSIATGLFSKTISLFWKQPECLNIRFKYRYIICCQRYG